MLRTQLQALRDAGHRTDIEEDRMIVNVEEAQREKAVGNSDFQGKRWGDAVAHFTSALEFDPTDHILWSNRHARACRERAHSRRTESLMWIYVVDAGSPRI